MKGNTTAIPEYKTAVQNGIVYYKKRIKDADGKYVSIYGKTPEELHKKVQDAKAQIEDALYRRANPTVGEYCEKWLTMKSTTIRPQTLRGYSNFLRKYVIESIGDMFLDEVTSDDLNLLMLPLSKMSSYSYNTGNMLIKSIFYSAEDNHLIQYNPSELLCPRGGKPKEKKEALSDEQVNILIQTVKDLPPYLFVMLGLYAGLRREETLALQWDCVFLDVKVPYISVRRTWRTEKNRPIISTELKTPASKRDIPIPKCLADCLRAEKEKSISKFVIADSNGEVLSYSQYVRLWNYIKVRTAKERSYYQYINGQKIKRTMHPQLGDVHRNNHKIIYTIDFDVTSHKLRHTYITNLIYRGVDPKTVQYLAGHKNSKETMDIYAAVKYNKPKELIGVVNQAFSPKTAQKQPNSVGEI